MLQVVIKVYVVLQIATVRDFFIKNANSGTRLKMRVYIYFNTKG